MKTFVEFRSSQFPAYEGEEEEINPGVWGKRLAEYFAARLPAHGVSAHPIIAEDWGWYVPLEIDGVRCALCCGHQDGEDDEFLCFTEPDRPVVSKFLRKVDMTAPLTRLVGAVDAILRADPEIRDIVWREP